LAQTAAATYIHASGSSAGEAADFLRELTLKPPKPIAKGAAAQAKGAATAVEEAKLATEAVFAESAKFGPGAFFSLLHPASEVETARRAALFLQYPGFKVWYRHEM
jgi:hypothetical protein